VHRVLNVHGQVVTIELFSTTLRQLDPSHVVIPNRKIVGEILHNYGTIRQLQLKVGVAYNANIEQVIGVAKEIVAASPRALKTPEPMIGAPSWPILRSHSRFNRGSRWRTWSGQNRALPGSRRTV
jgi:small-conductance mechanosensitive channel